MKNKYSDLSNEELYTKLKENIKDNELIFHEITERQEKGKLIRPYDPLLEKYSKKAS